MCQLTSSNTPPCQKLLQKDADSWEEQALRMEQKKKDGGM
jgi:hypothetical protein